MTMQPMELKGARQELGMTQHELAEALGLTPQFIGMMERGEKPIEQRTALAVRQIFNERTRLYGNADPGQRENDVPLRDAMIIWDKKMSPRLKVVANGSEDDDRYSSSYGACNSDWAHADDVGRLLRLFSRMPEWTVIDGIPPREVHDALWVIPEYRRSVAQESLFSG
jgi:DNA-binding XRE family transcriptional regulator